MPTEGDTSRRNFHLVGQFYQWMMRYQNGEGFDSAGGFILPNGSTRSPDLS
jgi:Uma2 family endonuclease